MCKIINWDEEDEDVPARKTEDLYFYADVYSSFKAIPEVNENGITRAQRNHSTRGLQSRNRL